jgi:acetyltransferase
MIKIEKFFNPKSVVVIGATAHQGKLGYGVSRNLISSGFRGEVYFVNTKGGVIFGRQVYPSVDHLPKKDIDLAVHVIPAAFVAEALNACSHFGIKNHVIISGGFSETGKPGVDYETECINIANENGLSVLGPNCIGVIDTHYPIDTTFLQPPMPRKGGVAFLTQSGALGAGVIDWARGEGFSFSKILSLGNQMAISASDVLVPFAEDKDTRVITMYLESVKEGRKFVEQARLASAQKPVLVHKVGRTAAGKKAASSHTGALAGVDTAFDAAFRRGGILRAETTEELFDWAKMLAWAPLPTGDRVAILTNAGGPGVTAADAVGANGLAIAKLSQGTKEKLGAILPEVASLENPVDMLASATAEIYAACLEILIGAEEVDMVIVISPPPPMFPTLEVVEACIPVIEEHKEKPVVFSLMGSEQVEGAVRLLRTNKIPEYGFPERAASALGALWRRVSIEKSIGEKPFTYGDVDRDIVGVILAEEKSNGNILVHASVTERILDAYGIPIAKLHLADSPASSREISNEIGYPVVLKIAADGISHKSEIGGIQLDLADDEEVLAAYEQLTKAVEAQDANIQVRGAYVQKMVSDGQEVIVGAVRDPIFGPLVMFGSGGVEVEGLKDVTFSLAPITPSDLNYLINSSWAGKRLKGFRHYNPADIDGVKEVLIRLGQLMVDHEAIQEVEINPLSVFEQGHGVLALDMRMYIYKT